MQSDATVRQQNGVPFSWNWSAAVGEEEENTQTTEPMQRRVALNNVSFPVELVSSSLGSFSSDLTQKSNSSSRAMITVQRISVKDTSFIKNRGGTHAIPPFHRRCQSVGNTVHCIGNEMSIRDPYVEVKSSVAEQGIKKQPFRRHSVDVCDPKHLKDTASETSGSSVSSQSSLPNAFLTCHPQHRGTKRPPRFSPLKKISVRARSSVDSFSRANKKATPSPSSSSNATANKPCSGKRSLKDSCRDSELDFENEDQQCSRLTTTTVVELRTSSRERTSGHARSASSIGTSWRNSRQSEGSMKRVFANFLTCFCGAHSEEEKEKK